MRKKLWFMAALLIFLWAARSRKTTGVAPSAGGEEPG